MSTRRHARWLGLAVAGLGLGACEGVDDRLVTVPSVGEQPVECLTVEVEQLLPEVDQVLAVASDGIGSPGAWVLALDHPPDDENTHLFVVRRPGPNDPELEPIDLGFAPQTADDVRVWPSAEQGRAYLLRQGPSRADLWLLDASEGIVAAGSLTSVPGVGSIDDWDRHVVFLDGQAWVLAVPRISTTLSIRYFAGRLDENLHSASVWELPFVHPCELADAAPDPELCASLQLLRTEMIVGATNAIVGGRDATVLLEKRRVADIGSIGEPVEELHADVSLLRLDIQGDAPAGSLLTIPRHDEVIGDPPPVVPLALAQDPFTNWVSADDVLYAVDGSRPNAVIYRDPFDGSGQLLQLALTTVVAETSLGAWRIAVFTGRDPLQGGDFEVRTVIEHGVAAVEPAGPGRFLVRRLDGAPPMLVRLDCTEFPVAAD